MSLSAIQKTVIAAGFSASIVFALLGAALAMDEAPAQAMEPVERGDRLADPDASAHAFTVEEVNLDIGVSNLIRIEREAPGS